MHQMSGIPPPTGPLLASQCHRIDVLTHDAVADLLRCSGSRFDAGSDAK